MLPPKPGLLLPCGRIPMGSQTVRDESVQRQRSEQRFCVGGIRAVDQELGKFNEA